MSQPSSFQPQTRLCGPWRQCLRPKAARPVLRDFSWYLRLVTYGGLAGSTSFIESAGLIGAREMYNSLGVPMPGMLKRCAASRTPRSPFCS